jgi:phosphoglycolate phosphatase-like HAD superfamily hydrolase
MLVLWDVDYTLVDADGVGRELYKIAFTRMFGGTLPEPGPMSGRTDSAIVLEVLRLAGVPRPREQVPAFQAIMAAHAADLADQMRARGRALPGAAAALAAVADGRSGRRPGLLVQSLLTGNVPALAEVKLSALGLTEHLDLSVGAYGDTSEERADLVAVARRKAGKRYSADFGGRATVLVGDTPLDVGAALATGARAVGVATGSFTAGELAAAGAHAVLPDLTDTPAVVNAVLSP